MIPAILTVFACHGVFVNLSLWHKSYTFKWEMSKILWCSPKCQQFSHVMECLWTYLCDIKVRPLNEVLQFTIISEARPSAEWRAYIWSLSTETYQCQSVVVDCPSARIFAMEFGRDVEDQGNQPPAPVYAINRSVVGLTGHEKRVRHAAQTSSALVAPIRTFFIEMVFERTKFVGVATAELHQSRYGSTCEILLRLADARWLGVEILIGSQWVDGICHHWRENPWWELYICGYVIPAERFV